MKTVHDCLMKLTLRELSDLGFRLLAAPPENRRVRAMWCAAIEKAMEDRRELLLCLAKHEWETLERYARLMCHDEPTQVPLIVANHMSELSSVLGELRLLGLAWRDVHQWNVNPLAYELAQMAQADKETFEIIEEKAETMAGYLMLYGMLPVRELTQMVMEQSERDEQMEGVLLDLHRKRYGLSGMTVENGQVWLISPDVNDPAALYTEVTSDEMLVKPYARYSVKEALYACHEGVPGRPDAYDELLDAYTKAGMNLEDVKDVLSEAIYYIHNGEYRDALFELAAALGRPPEPNELHAMQVFFAHVPLWTLKGRCMEDFFPSTTRLSKRVRQDDPCPCGSGRKYKYCCGRLQ